MEKHRPFYRNTNGIHSTFRKEQSFLLNIHRMDSIKSKPQKLIKANSKMHRNDGSIEYIARQWQCRRKITRVSWKQDRNKSTQTDSATLLNPIAEHQIVSVWLWYWYTAHCGGIVQCAVQLYMHRQRVCISVCKYVKMQHRLRRILIIYAFSSSSSSSCVRLIFSDCFGYCLFVALSLNYCAKLYVNSMSCCTYMRIWLWCNSFCRLF